MAKTVTALYENYPTAHSAVQDLVNHNFRRDDIRMMAQEALTKDDAHVSEEETSGTTVGVGVGAAIGGVGGLGVGLAALALPGIGPIITAGPLVAALGGVGVGTAAGGLIGTLTDIGVPEEEAHYYAEGVRRGGVLVTVHTADGAAERAASVLATHHPIDLTRHGKDWRQRGWNRFETDADPSVLVHSAPTYMRTPDKVYDSKAHTVVPAAHQIREPACTPTHATVQETTILVVEEDLPVGKRQTERDVHVRTTMAIP